MGKRTEFLFMSEPDMIEAGVLDAKACTDTCEEVFKLLAQGDYLMGGANHNSHGMGIVFPETSPFKNMPVAGPDRRFVAMPGYLGGRFDVCGVKWYGSNQENKKHGLPRSVLTVMLNDKETGEPLVLMSANLLSSARTGGVPAVASRYLAPQGSEVLAVVGCGAINKSCTAHIVSQNPSLQKVVCYDLFPEAASAFVKFVESDLGLQAQVAKELPDAVGEADLVTVAASRLKPLGVEDSWFKQKATVLLTGPMQANEEFWTKSQIVYDNIHLHEAYVQEAREAPDLDAAYDAVIGGPLYRLIDQDKLPELANSLDLGHLILDSETARETERDRKVFVACGMSVFDLGWGYDLYKRALAKNIGTKLTLWDEPHQA